MLKKSIFCATILCSGFKNIDLGLNGIDGRIAAFGDFDGDLHSDLVILNTKQTEITLMYYTPQKYTLKKTIHIQDLVTIPKSGIFGDDYKIVNVINSDFNQDGMLDFLVVFSRNIRTAEEGLYLALVLQQPNGDFSYSKKTNLDLKPWQPFVADITGKLEPALIAQKSDKAQMQGWIYSLDSEFDFIPPEKVCQIAHPHSNAFLDLDGDCLSDLFLVCNQDGKQTVQIWLNRKSEGFVFHSVNTLPDGAGPITFADMNADGAIDMVFPVCHDYKCSIHVAYNNQKGFCDTSNPNCRDPHDLCKSDPNFSFDFGSINSIDFEKIVPESGIVTRDTSFSGILPIPLRIGDYDNDGYPDLIVVSNARRDPQRLSLRLLHSIPCDKKCSTEEANSNKRSFSLTKSGVDLLKITSPVGAAFLDMMGDGILDLFLFYKDKNGLTATQSLANQFYHDTFFLSYTVLNSVCLGTCNGNQSQPYGVNYAGATLKHSVVDTKGQLRVVQTSQLPQQAYQSLMTATSIVGLGRTNNYIEDLFVGVTRHSEHVGSYQGIIPNSAIVIGPHQEQGQNPASWKFELYMNPSSTTTAILVVLAITLITLAIVIFVLDMAERREDDLERKTRLHNINFDAL